MTPDTYIKPHSITRVNTQQPALIPNTQYPIPNHIILDPGPWTLDPGQRSKYKPKMSSNPRLDPNLGFRTC